MAGEPLVTLSYTLTSADALAYETLPRELTGWRRWLFLLWMIGAGIVLALLPEDWVGPDWGWRFILIGVALVGLAWLLAAATMTLARHRAARRRLPRPQSVELRQWGDHLEVVTDGRQAVIAYETIAAVTTTATHVFINAPPAVIIVPARAFEEPAEMQTFGADVDRLSQASAD